jgi:hypothetical protein
MYEIKLYNKSILKIRTLGRDDHQVPHFENVLDPWDLLFIKHKTKLYKPIIHRSQGRGREGFLHLLLESRRDLTPIRRLHNFPPSFKEHA